MNKFKSWIGVDFDGTLVEHEFPLIGADVPIMVERVDGWLCQRYKVKIVTARACNDGKYVAAVRDWLDKKGWYSVEITNQKDYNMIELWDDRAVAVERNTGVQLSPSVVQI